MNGEAALSTGFLHLLGVILTLMPLGHRPARAMMPEVKTLVPVETHAPALALAPESGQPGGADGVGPSLSEGRGCPESPPVDSGAAPDFPLFGDRRPFRHVPQARWSPVFCARIDRNGRVLEVRPAISSSGNVTADQAAARELAHLRFRPAARDGRHAEAWHRILIYLPGTSISSVPPSTRIGAVNGTYPVEFVRITD